MIKQIKCDCGKELNLKYETCSTVLSGALGSVKKIYSWMCDSCGQEYMEEAKSIKWLN